MSIQVAILKVLASHGNGRATLASLKRDLIVLSASGDDWGARLRRLAGRVPSIDIFGSGYVLCDRQGWEITPEGREFLETLEAVTQDNLITNLITESEPPALPASGATERPPGTLIVVGHRFKNRRGTVTAGRIGFAREEGFSKLK